MAQNWVTTLAAWRQCATSVNADRHGLRRISDRVEMLEELEEPSPVRLPVLVEATDFEIYRQALSHT